MNSNTLVHADIFFFITAIAVVLLTLLLVVILYFVAKTARTVSQIAEKVKKESDGVIEDISDLREKIKESTSDLSGFSKWILSFILGKAASSVFKKSGTSKSNRKKASTTADEE